MRLAKRALAGVLLIVLCLGGWVAVGQKEPIPYEYVKDELLVRFAPNIPKATIDQINATIGAQVLQSFQIVSNLYLVKIPAHLSVPEAIARYKGYANVLYAEPNYIVRTAQHVQLTPNDPNFTQLWGLHNTGQTGGTPDADIDAPEAWDITTGSSSVVVFVIDTGVDYNHPDLVANVWTNPGEIPGNNVDDDGNGYIDDVYGIDTFYNDTNPFDGDGHGTHVHGTIGAVGNNSVGVVGVNWSVKVGHCKFLSDSGSGSTAGAISCLQYILNLKQTGNPANDIIATNNSWGGGGFSQALYDAIKAHMNAGILFIAAAGNSSANNDTALFLPASYYLPNVISVAATTHTDAKAGFSNYGRRTVHVGAPGQGILSTTPGNTYSTFSGTSMATPHVTGLAALIKAQFPSFTWYQIRNRILATGDVTTGMQNVTISDRRINAYGALTCNNVPFFGIWRPFATASWPMLIAVYWVNCENPAGPISVTITPGGTVLDLLDDGNEAVSGDIYAGDGVYSAIWTGPADICVVGTFTLTFSNGQSTTVQVGGAQGSYRCTTPSPTWRTITGTNLNLGDDTSTAITPGFPVKFGTTSYTTVNVGSNGVLSFTDSITAYSNTQLPNTSYTTIVAPFWDDLYPTGADNVYWEVLGTAPNRELVIEWRNVRHYSCSSDASATVRFQVVLFEATNHVLFNYQDVIFGGNCANLDKGGSATIGVQVSTTDATQIGFNSQILSDNLTVHWTTVTATGRIFRVERTTGNVYAAGSFNPGGADVAEYILASEPLEPGDVVELDPHNPKHYRKAREPYSPWVAGVISTAPGFVLGAKLSAGRPLPQPLPDTERGVLPPSPPSPLPSEGEGSRGVRGLGKGDGGLGLEPGERPLLALLGRVPVKATTESGPIRPGDLLTSASKPGYAMRCEDIHRCEGAIIGKALEALDKGEGVILILLMR
jgi:subtilisin family serine protease